MMLPVVNKYMLLVAVGTLALFEGCDVPFLPSAAFEPKMVVYCVLTTESDTQYVRVYGTYDPPDNDPAKNLEDHPVTDATVTISSDSALYQFHEGTVNRPDKSRYSTGIVAYVSYPFRPARGVTYKLTVSSPTYGTATAVTTAPGVAQISTVNFFCMRAPYSCCCPWWDYGVQAQLSVQAKGFLVRAYAQYLASTPRGWELKRRQIPIRMESISLYQGTWEFLYPSIRRRSSYSAGYREGEVFPTETWAKFLENVIWASDGDGVRFQDVIFQVIQFDAALYDSYSVANLFRDPYSQRLDEADYTNISGGVGLFGSVAVDSIVSPLPESISRVGSR
jgi:hypothetical protein